MLRAHPSPNVLFSYTDAMLIHHPHALSLCLTSSPHQISGLKGRNWDGFSERFAQAVGERYPDVDATAMQV